LAKILEFKKSNRRVLEDMKKDAMRELHQMYKITGGFQFPTPPILDEDLLKAFYDGTVEF